MGTVGRCTEPALSTSPTVRAGGEVFSHQRLSITRDMVQNAHPSDIMYQAHAFPFPHAV